MRKKVGLGKFSILIKITCVTEFYLYRIFMCIYTLVYTYIKKSIKVGHKILICVYFKVVEFQVIFTFSFLANVTQLGRGRARFQCIWPAVFDPTSSTLSHTAHLFTWDCSSGPITKTGGLAEAHLLQQGNKLGSGQRKGAGIPFSNLGP